MENEKERKSKSRIWKVQKCKIGGNGVKEGKSKIWRQREKVEFEKI
jgi:hypothetical protein